MLKLIKLLLRLLLRLLYRVEVEGMEHFHQAGNRVLIVANHNSLLDGLLLYAWLPETPTYAINPVVAAKPSYKFFLRFVDLFLMDPTEPLSVKAMIKYIKQDHKAIIFPEGRITTTGTLMKIYDGPGLIADKADATILPIGIEGTQYSHASYMRDAGQRPRFAKIRIRILPPEKIDIPANVRGAERRDKSADQIQLIMYKLMFAAYKRDNTVFTALLDSMKNHGRKQIIMEDIKRQPLNYGQFLTRIFILARVFRSRTQPEEIVGLLLPNVAATTVSYMALQCLGRVPAMLNYSAGIQALRQACETASLKTVYSSRAFIDKAKLQDVITELERSVDIVYLEDLAADIGPLDKLIGLLRSYYPYAHYRRQRADQSPDKPATVLFTSGSEGAPKGVLLSHGNILTNYAQTRCYMDFRPNDILFNCLPLFHCFGLVVGCIMPLLSGSRTFLYPTPLHYRIIPEYIYSLNATVLFSTNTFLRGYGKHAHPYDFSTLRHVVAGAEKLQQETVQAWMDKFGIRILQGYGVTECSPVVSANTPMENRHGTVGRLLPGMQSYLQPVDGIDEGGELVLSGPNVMLGYLLHDRPGELIPPSTDRGPGWYATGDIVSMDDKGFLTIVGRAKRFAKIGGEMVPLVIVEELAARTWPDSSHAAISLPDERKGEKIILITNHRDADRKALQETIKALGHTELYLPVEIMFAEEIPLLGGGKTDYVSLKKQITQELS
ncbi:MAG: AMP-binding protein [Gammaproteobacteria bacterium]